MSGSSATSATSARTAASRPSRPTPGRTLGPTPGDPALAAQLTDAIAGDVLFARADRGRYATDASIYQVMPEGVIVPHDVEDVAAAIAICRAAGVPVLARGGGTSQSGQTVNRALVIDCTKHLRRVLAIDPEAKTAWSSRGWCSAT